jgi:hypothetical protein
MAIVSTFLITVPPSAAVADPFGGCNSDEGCEADSAEHIYCYGAGFNNLLEDEADFAMNTSLDAQTQMTADRVGCTSATDVRWFDANLPGSIRGQYDCTNPGNPGPGDICLASDVTLDPDEINQGDDDPEDRKKTACHEVGHSVGLIHGDNKDDCMINGPIPDTTAQWRNFSNHHVQDHINPTY